MDTDSFLLHTIEFDVFAYMRDNGFQYGWHSLQLDLPEVVHRLGNKHPHTFPSPPPTTTKIKLAPLHT